MNTTELIKHWTMQGATPDVGRRFRSIAGILAIASDAPEPGTQDALRMREADDEEWRPLLLATGEN